GSSEGWGPSDRARDEDGLATLMFDTQEYEFGVRLPELLLMRIDRFSMANSVEARVPFLDPELVDYVYSLPVELKLAGGTPKSLLKQALVDILPAEVALRPKRGFAAPASSWFIGQHGALLAQLMGEDALAAYFDIDQLRRFVQAGDPGSYEFGRVLW